VQKQNFVIYFQILFGVVIMYLPTTWVMVSCSPFQIFLRLRLKHQIVTGWSLVH